MAVEGKGERVCVFVPSLHGGGAERMMVNLANAMADKGFAVDLVLAQAEGPYLREVSAAVRLVNLRKGSITRCLSALARYFRQERPLYIVSALSHANLVAIVARMLSGIRARLIISERSVLFADGMPEVGFKDRVIRYLMKGLYRYSDGIVAISKGVQTDLERWISLPAGHVRTIYNPVVTKELEELAAAPSPHPWLNDPACPVILGVGRLTVQKDFPTLIRAFANVRASRRCRLVILGEGELRADLEALVSDLGLAEDVLFPGFLENPFPWMKGAGVFVFSSIWEGLGGVLIQAMACGTPVISTDCPSGPAEILENGRWGRLVPVGDVEALSVAIAETLDDGAPPDVRQRASFFSDTRSTDEYLKFCLGQPE